MTLLNAEPDAQDADAASSKMGPAIIFAWLCVVLAVASAVLVKLSIPAMMLALIAFLSLPKHAKKPKIALMVVAPLIVLVLLRSTAEKAASGVVEGGRRAGARSAMAHLRDIVFAQNIGREQAYIDPDGDKIGSAMSLWALGGLAPQRAGTKPPMLLQRFRHQAQSKDGGPELVLYDGYLFAVYLPTTSGGATTKESGGIDDEAAERRFVAYAWPFERGHAEHQALFIDEHERILVTDNADAAQGYFGVDNPPPFNAAFQAEFADKGWDAPPAVDGAAVKKGGTSDSGRGVDGAMWHRWRHKEARADLPGDRVVR